MPSRNTYHLTWVSLSLNVGYLFMAKGIEKDRMIHFSKMKTQYKHKDGWMAIYQNINENNNLSGGIVSFFLTLF